MSIAEKILKAQMSVQAVAKDAKNAFHKYDYVSSEAMIADCRNALHAAGLSVVCVGRKITDKVLTSTFRVADDKDHLEMSIDFPIVPDKGRPEDKAAAGAMTTSLSYFLRDLLLVPRKDEADINRRDDTRYDPSKTERAKLVSRFGQEIAKFSGEKPGSPAYTAAGQAVMKWMGYERTVAQLDVNELSHAIDTLLERIAEGATFDDVTAFAAK